MKIWSVVSVLCVVLMMMIIIPNCVLQQELAPTNFDTVDWIESSATTRISSDISAPREVKGSNTYHAGDEECKVTKEVKRLTLILFQ